MPQTILHISVGQMVLICIFILIILFVITKAKGIKGSWSKKSEIDPFINHSLSFYVPEEDELKDSEGERICRKFLRETVGVLLKIEMETRNLLIKQDLIFLKILSLLAKMEILI